MTLTDTGSDVSGPSEDVPPILLPAAGDGQRRRRRHERQRVVRQRWLALGAVAVAAVAAVLLLKGTHSGNKPATNTQPTTAVTQFADPNAAAAAAAPPTVLIQQVNNGRTTSLAAFLPVAEGGGTVLVFPANTTLTEVNANLPRHKADTTLTLQDADLARLLAPAGAVAVPVGSAPQTIAPDQVAAFFTSSGSVDKLTRQRAYWDAWLTRVHDQPTAMPTQPALSTAVTTIVKGIWTVAVPPGTAGG
ncbi:MAG: hypothetical protein JO367_04200 [Actinobacteria bacterium]|nr:hypothetical protein [Actinomycetota bacterium]